VRQPKLQRLIFAALAAACALLVSGAPARAAGPAFVYDDYGAALSAFVGDDGMVDYRGLRADAGTLDAFVGALAALDPGRYERWPEQEKIAFWVNAYNGLTLKAVISHYPIRPSFLGSLRFPENSIRQIPGVWDRLRFSVMGRERTLDEIEHAVLRGEFHEPRIHVALVCAAMGCPPLRREPYTGEQLSAQLDDQARRFLADPAKFRIDRAEGRAYLSPIFKWFGADFAASGREQAGFPGRSPAQRAVLAFVSRYLPEDDRRYLAGEQRYEIVYLDYDWSLNERRGPVLTERQCRRIGLGGRGITWRRGANTDP